MIDLPLVIGTTGSLAAFYAMAEAAQGRRRIDALKQLPALLALGAGLAPHLSKAVWEGLHSMAGEFVRTPKKGTHRGPLPRRGRPADDRDRALPHLRGQHRRLAGDGALVRHALRDALHVRVRLRRLLRRLRAARSAQALPRRAPVASASLPPPAPASATVSTPPRDRRTSWPPEGGSHRPKSRLDSPLGPLRGERRRS